MFTGKYKVITVSGKIAVGTSTLSKRLAERLGWKYMNAGEMQRKYDREHNMDTNRSSAQMRPDEREREVEEYTKKILETEQNIVYESWLAGFVAQNIEGVFKILVQCKEDSIRVDRVVNRDGMTVEEAKKYIREREEGNLEKWHKLYGRHDFWSEEKFDLVVDTYYSGPMETLGRVLDAVGYTY